MAAKSKRQPDPSEHPSHRVAKPFEPSRKSSASARSAQKGSVKQRGTSVAAGIPEVVSRRMVKRMALFCGVPTVLGMSTFVVSYLLVANDIFPLPTYAVLLVSLGWFGLGVLGLSYGALSASWNEEAGGSRLGFAEFAENWQRMSSAWRSQKKG